MSDPHAEARRICSVLLCSLLASSLAAAQPAAQPAAPSATTRSGHPLDSLTADEIQATTTVLRAHPAFPEGAQFVMMTVKEPAKNAVLAYAPGAPIARHSFSVLLDARGKVRID